MAAIAPKLLSKEDAAAHGGRLVQEGWEAPAAARNLIDSVDPQDWRDLAIGGLSKLIHDERAKSIDYANGLADGVENDTEIDIAAGPIWKLARPRHPAAEYWRLILDVTTYNVGGEVKKVLNLTLADAERLRDTFRSRSRGLAKSADAMALTARLLGAAKAETVQHLSTESQKKIAEALR